VQKIFAIAVVALGTVGSIHSAIAADNYYLEIGKQGTSDYVNSEWKEISQKHKKLLGDLKLYPKAITNQDGGTEHIIQTGPIVDKEKADKICAKLFTKNISCFVIEGAEDAPPSKSAGFAQVISGIFNGSSAPTPWVDDATPKVLGSASAPTPVTENTPSNDKPSDVAEGKVDVAQAIPVPLSVDKDYNEKAILNNIQENPTARPAEKVASTAAPVVTKELSPVEFASGSAGWLDVSSFSSEKNANKFWNEVRAKFPDLTAGLRVRIKKSLGANDTQLSFGPFPSSSDANKFCITAITALNTGLNCIFQGSNSPKSENIEEVPVKYDHAKAYEERRKMLLSSSHNSERTSSKNNIDNLSVVTHESGDRNFWAQVVIADSKVEATDRIQEIQSANSDILDGVSSSVTTSPIRHTKYNARLGPLATEQAASELCDTLQQRGIDCLVIATK